MKCNEYVAIKHNDCAHFIVSKIVHDFKNSSYAFTNIKPGLIMKSYTETCALEQSSGDSKIFRHERLANSINYVIARWKFTTCRISKSNWTNFIPILFKTTLRKLTFCGMMLCNVWFRKSLFFILYRTVGVMKFGSWKVLYSYALVTFAKYFL